MVDLAIEILGKGRSGGGQPRGCGDKKDTIGCKFGIVSRAAVLFIGGDLARDQSGIVSRAAILLIGGDLARYQSWYSVKGCGICLYKFV